MLKIEIANGWHTPKRALFFRSNLTIKLLALKYFELHIYFRSFFPYAMHKCRWLNNNLIMRNSLLRISFTKSFSNHLLPSLLYQLRWHSAYYVKNNDQEDLVTIIFELLSSTDYFLPLEILLTPFLFVLTQPKNSR